MGGPGGPGSPRSFGGMGVLGVLGVSGVWVVWVVWVVWGYWVCDILVGGRWFFGDSRGFHVFKNLFIRTCVLWCGTRADIHICEFMHVTRILRLGY